MPQCLFLACHINVKLHFYQQCYRSCKKNNSISGTPQRAMSGELLPVLPALGEGQSHPCENSTSWSTSLCIDPGTGVVVALTDYLIPRYWAPGKLKGGSTYMKRRKEKQKEGKRRLSSPCTGLKGLSHSVKQAQSPDQVIRAQKCCREMFYLYYFFF